MQATETATPTNLQELVTFIQHPLFADRADLNEAFEYFFSVMESINSADRVAAMTAAFVVLNTVANDIERLSEEG